MVGALVALEMAKNLVAATLYLEVSGMYIDTSEASCNGRGVGGVRNGEEFGSSNVTFGSIRHVH